MSMSNPVRQPWRRNDAGLLAHGPDIPQANATPFHQRVQRVRDFPGLVQEDNPQARLIELLNNKFERRAVESQSN